MPKTIKLTKGYETLVDDDDYDKLISLGSFHISQTGYAIVKIAGKNVRLHRIINNTPEDMMTDHINRNRLDNRKANLRSVNAAANAQNGAGRVHWIYKLPKGITFDKSRNKYLVHRPTRRFDTLEQALGAI